MCPGNARTPSGVCLRAPQLAALVPKLALGTLVRRQLSCRPAAPALSSPPRGVGDLKPHLARRVQHGPASSFTLLQRSTAVPFLLNRFHASPFFFSRSQSTRRA